MSCSRVATLAVLTGLLCAGLFACKAQDTPPARNLHVEVAFGSAPVSLDPHYSNESVAYSINSNIYEALVRTDPELNLVPSLAEKWTNPDDLTWVFDLDPRAKFHNGKACTSDDVAYSLDRVRTDPRSDWKGSLVAIDRIEAPSPYKVVIHTRRPCPTLLRMLAEIAVVPRNAASLEQHPIGTGPYRFVRVDWKRGIIDLQRWTEYRGTQAQIESGTFRWVADGKERLRLLKARAVDLITDVSPEQFAEVQSDPGLKIAQIPSLRVLYIAFDVQRKHSPYVDAARNPFLDRRVRLAVMQALDRERLVKEQFHGIHAVATQVVAPAVFGFDPDKKMPGYNLEYARSLMKEAGYANGFGVVLDTPENTYPGDVAVAGFIAESLKQIGIRVRVNAMPKPVLFEKVGNRDTSFYLLSWNCLSADAQEVFTFLLHTPDPARGYGSDNSGSYSNADVDRLSELAEQTMDSGKRLELLKAALAEVMDDVPWVPIYVQTHIFGVGKRLEWRPREDKVILFSEMKLAE